MFDIGSLHTIYSSTGIVRFIIGVPRITFPQMRLSIDAVSFFRPVALSVMSEALPKRDSSIRPSGARGLRQWADVLLDYCISAFLKVAHSNRLVFSRHLKKDDYEKMREAVIIGRKILSDMFAPFQESETLKGDVERRSNYHAGDHLCTNAKRMGSNLNNSPFIGMSALSSYSLTTYLSNLAPSNPSPIHIAPHPRFHHIIFHPHLHSKLSMRAC